MKRFVYQILFPLTTAMIWGSSFVAQSESADHIGAFTFNATRSLVGFAVLLLLIPLLRRLEGGEKSAVCGEKSSFKSLLWVLSRVDDFQAMVRVDFGGLNLMRVLTWILSEIGTTVSLSFY